MVYDHSDGSNKRLSAAELPINNRGAVYHLDLKTDELADVVITVGDPARVSEVSNYFDRIEVKRQHREFITHTGYLGNLRISVVSTGIGTPNIDIVMNELDAVANINLLTREINAEKRQLTIIRLGTTGGLLPSCEPGDLVITRFAIGMDTLFNFYQYPLSTELDHLKQNFASALDIHEDTFYVGESCPQLTQLFAPLGRTGITATCSGFYGPQGRSLRIPVKNPDLLNQLRQFKVNDNSILNLEMETAAIYAFGNILGHRCLSLSVVLANRTTGNFTQEPKKLVDMLITKSLLIIKDKLVPTSA